MRYLLIHGNVFDWRLNNPVSQWGAAALDRLLNTVDNGALNSLRATLVDDNRNNDDLIAGAKALRYPTICGHSHVAAAIPPTTSNLYGFWNCGSRGSHYVLFPKAKIVCISDLHLGSHQSEPYHQLIIDLFCSTAEHGWSVYFLGDTVDSWAHSPEEIWDIAWEPLELVREIAKLTVLRGNHDGDERVTRMLLGIPATRQLPWYEFVDTDDTPELIGFGG
jgi:Calcineurin-like phosphoesterase